MDGLVSEWYSLLGTLNRAVSGPLGELSRSSTIPIVSALLLGLLASTSPCQLTTNAGALAFILRRPGDRRLTALSAIWFMVGKVLVYTLVGVSILLLGAGLQQTSIPVVVTVRKLLGPLMLMLGLTLLGVLGSGPNSHGGRGDRTAPCGAQRHAVVLVSVRGELVASAGL